MFKFERIDTAAVILMMSANPARWAGHSDTTHLTSLELKDREPLCSFNHVSILLRPLCVQYRFMMIRSSEEYAAVRWSFETQGTKW